MSWPLWFVQLSGWPVFLAVVGLVFVFMLALSVAFTWLGSRRVMQSMVIATLTLTVLALAALMGLALLTRSSAR
jgi:hypothetical protein